MGGTGGRLPQPCADLGVGNVLTRSFGRDDLLGDPLGEIDGESSPSRADPVVASGAPSRGRDDLSGGTVEALSHFCANTVVGNGSPQPFEGDDPVGETVGIISRFRAVGAFYHPRADTFIKNLVPHSLGGKDCFGETVETLHQPCADLDDFSGVTRGALSHSRSDSVVEDVETDDLSSAKQVGALSPFPLRLHCWKRNETVGTLHQS